ncbi:MAG TPA: hemerythrin domain-containing protein [Polyangiaceae bacterium]|nr:hemerythrin domain-containing protein [Polyangiaceae bacterium]
MASKAMGAMKAAKATIEGLSGIFKHLAREHGEVTALLMRVKMSSDGAVRRDLFPKIRSELLSHERGELREVYPVFRQHAELRTIADNHDREAGQLEQMLDDLNATSYDDSAWASKFGKLVDLVSHHAKEEENDFFPAASKVIGKDEAEQMKTRYETTKAELMQSIS